MKTHVHCLRLCNSFSFFVFFVLKWPQSASRLHIIVNRFILLLLLSILFCTDVESRCKVSLEGPALMVENAEVEAELLASDGGSKEGLLKVSCGPGLDGGC